MHGSCGQRSGVSGGTIAFLLGFYDSFINSLNDIMGRDNAKRKKAFFFLIKLGVGWVIGMLLAVSVLANVFESGIYKVSSLFLGFINSCDTGHDNGRKREH